MPVKSFAVRDSLQSTALTSLQTFGKADCDSKVIFGGARFRACPDESFNMVCMLMRGSNPGIVDAE